MQAHFNLRIRLVGVATHPTFAALAALTALWALFFWRLLTPAVGDRVLFAEGDFTQHYYAFASYQAERVWQGQLPLWNPYNHAGEPFAANIQWAMWYPPRWLAILIAGPGGFTVEAYQFETAAHIWLASMLTYAFLRTISRRSWPPLVGAVVFAYGGYLTGYPLLQPGIIEAAVWLPLMLLGVHLSVHEPRCQVQGGSLAGLAVGISFLGGHPQTTMQMAYLGLAYLAFTGWQARLRWHAILWRGALIAAVGAGAAAVQLLPAAQLARLSSRVVEYHYADKSNGFAPVELLGLIWPRVGGAWSPLYAGVAGFLLAIAAVFRRRARHFFWLGVIVVSLWLAMGRNSIVYDFFYSVVPGFSIFREQERAAYLVAFALAVLAADHLDWLLSRQALASGEAEPPEVRRFSRLARLHLAVTGGALLAAIVVNRLPPADLAGNPLVNTLAFVVLVSVLVNIWAAWLRQDSGPAWRATALLVLITAADLFTIGMRTPNYIPDTPENRVAPPGAIETLRPDGPVAWHVDGAAGLQGYGAYFRVPDVYGTGPFTLASVDALRRLPVDRFWEVLSVRYTTILTGIEPPIAALDLLAYHRNYAGEEYQVFELLDPRPFAHLVYDYREASGSPEFGRQIMSDPAVNLREMAVTLYPLPITLPGERPAGAQVSGFLMRTPERLEMVVSTPENALLTLALPNYPGWRAMVNGRPVEIVDVYAGLVGVPVRPGEGQRIEVRFAPPLVALGGAISALTLAAVAGQAAISALIRQRTALAARR